MKNISREIIGKLKEAGFEAYWAGGTVRDYLRGFEPKDYDIVTSARPEQIESLLEKTIPIGKQFGVILAVRGDHHFEVATFRSDAAYSDGRHPDAVCFSDPKEDALRRDFTVNGMFLDPESGDLLDFVEGQEDLKNKILRFIGDPERRIKEDHLRLMRAIRLKNALGFDYAPGAFEAIRENACLIQDVSKERIREELSKIMALPGREKAFEELDDSGILGYVLPEVLALKGVAQPDKFHKEGDVFRHTLMAIEALPAKVPESLAWATLLHDIAKPEAFAVTDRIRFNHHAEKGADIADGIMRRLNFSNREREKIAWLIKHHMMLGDIPKMKEPRQIHWITHPYFDELLELLKADALGAEPKDLSLYYQVKETRDKLAAKKTKPLPRLVSGHELMAALGLSQGPEVGSLLSEIREAQLDGRVKTKNQAFNYARKILNEG